MKYKIVKRTKKTLTDAVPAYTYVKEGLPLEFTNHNKTELPKIAVKTVNESKRRFLSASLVTGLATGKLLAQQISGDILPKRELKRQIPIALVRSPLTICVRNVSHAIYV